MQISPKLLFLTLMAAAVVSAAQVAEPAFSITISAEQNVVAVNSEVKVKIILKNTSNHDIGMKRANAADQGEFHNELTIRDEHGKLQVKKKPVSNFKDKDGHDMGDVYMVDEEMVLFTLKPGESLEDGIVLSHVYDVLKPGKYSLQVKRTDDTTKTVVKSNTITLTVTP